MSKFSKQSNTKRQAVIVIHGIGEQQPMATLRDFVDSVLDIKPDSNRPTYYSKPDIFSQSFELRCLTTPGNVRPRTDFFEFYWAHLMPKASWSRIVDWAWLIMNRNVKDVPRQFRGIWWISWIGLGALGISILMSVIDTIFHSHDGIESIFKAPFGVALIWLFLQALFLSYIGDAATYLSPQPQNIAARHAIRLAGVELLDSIHKSDEYDRIIIVGHSLGSVIGYDILNFAWHRYYKQHGCPENPQHELLEKAECCAVDLNNIRKQRKETPKDLQDEWINLVRDVRQELFANEHHWLVTDFITLGSPLAHADLLLARSREDLNHKIEQREIPISPPVVGSKRPLSFKIDYELPDGSIRTTFVPHHAAWTACVCWTNLYFPCRWFFKGDFVGGPLAPLFGSGVRDVPLKTKMKGGWLSHTLYWKQDLRDISAPDSPVKNLKLALDFRDSF